jgi:hypothetical protein
MHFVFWKMIGVFCINCEIFFDDDGIAWGFGNSGKFAVIFEAHVNFNENSNIRGRLKI